MKYKIRKELLELEKISYAAEHLEVPRGGIDCFEGCNPYGFPPELENKIKTFDIAKFAPYPHSNAIFEGLKEYWKGQVFLEPENLMITDGSISALYIINNILNIKGAKCLGISPQFTDFEMNIKLIGMEFEGVRLKKENNFKINVDEILEKMTEDINLVYIDNPNNPTGQVIPAALIEKILRKGHDLGIIVIVDEAYGDLMPNENSSIKYLEKYDNMIMVRTMSKAFGLAGLRVGYIIAAKPIIACMRKITNPYMVSEFAREMAGEALKHSEHIWNNVMDFAKQKREIRSIIGKNLHMAETCDTVSICVLYHSNKNINLKKEFYNNGVLCVSGNDFHGLDKSYVRIRLPRIDEFPKLLEAVKNIDRK